MKRVLKKDAPVSIQESPVVEEKAVADTYQLQNQSPADGLPSALPALLAALVAFGVYFGTSFPSISGGDSGELLMASCQLGVAHPPGYPTFTILTALALLLPVSPARAGNILSCAFSAVAVFFIYMCASYLSPTRNSFVSLLAAFLFAFNPTVWQYAGQSEVFALNNFLCSLLMFLSLCFFHIFDKEQNPPVITLKNLPNIHNNSKKRDVQTERTIKLTTSSTSYSLCIGYLGALVCGLAMTNQHTTVFYVFAIAASIALLLFLRGQLTVTNSLLFIGSVFLGMLPYLYMPLAASRVPADTWGDQTTIAGFLRHFLRVEYGTFQLAADGHEDPGMLSRLARYVLVLSQEAGYYIQPCFAIALVVLLRSSNKVIVQWTSTMLAAYLLYTAVFHKLANLELTPLYLGVQARFWMQSNIILLPIAAIGVEYIFSLFTWRYTKMLLSVSALLLTLIHFGLHFPLLNHGNDYILHHLAVDTLESFEQNAIVLLNGDLNHNLLKYFTSCEKKRPDLDLLSVQLMSWEWFHRQRAVYPRVHFPGMRYHPFMADSFSMDAFLKANHNRPIYQCGKWKDGDPTTNHKYTLVNSGLCTRVLDRTPTLDEMAKYQEIGIGNIPNLQQTGIVLSEHIPSTNMLAQPLELSPLLLPESWELAWAKDIVGQARYTHSYLAMIASQNAEKHPLLLQASYRTHEYLFTGATLADYADERNGCRKKQHCIPLIHFLNAFHEWSSDDDRAAGVIYGMYAELLQKQLKTAPKSAQKDIQGQITLCDRKMLYFWTKAVKSGKVDLKPFTDRKYNPYTGKDIVIQQGWMLDGQYTDPFISDVVKFNKRT